MHLESLESTQEARVALGCCLEQRLHFFRALQTSRMHPSLDIHTLSMNQFLNVRQPSTCFCVIQYYSYINVLNDACINIH